MNFILKIYCNLKLKIRIIITIASLAVDHRLVALASLVVGPTSFDLASLVVDLASLAVDLASLAVDLASYLVAFVIASFVVDRHNPLVVASFVVVHRIPLLVRY